MMKSTEKKQAEKPLSEKAKGRGRRFETRRHAFAAERLEDMAERKGGAQ
jgi:hypothetical protein